MSANYQSTDEDSLLNEEGLISTTHLSHQRVVIEISGQALLGSNMDQLIQHTLELLTSNLNIRFGEVLRYYPRSKKLQPQAGYGWPDDYFAQPPREIEKGSFANFVFAQDEVVVIRDFNKETRFKLPYFLANHKVVSGIATVVHGKEENFGILAVYSDEERHFNSIETNFVKKIGNILALIVDRQRIESSLSTSQDELETILNGIQEGISIQNESGQFIYVNDVALSLLGFKDRDSILNIPLEVLSQSYELFDESGEKLTHEQLPANKVFNGAESAKMILRYHHVPSREDRWLIVTSSPVKNVYSKQLFVVNIFQDITGMKRRELDQLILFQASEMFNDTSDYEKVLKSIAESLVKSISDWCVIHLLGENDEVEEIAAAHSDPEKFGLIQEIQRRFPPNHNFGRGIYHVIKTGEIEIYPIVSDNDLRQMSQNTEHYQLIKQLGIHSALIVPVIVSGKPIGSMSLIWSSLGFEYGDQEINLAVNLAQRAGLAIENARLYKNAKLLNDELESQVLKRTGQLENLIRRLQLQLEKQAQVERELQRSKTLFSDLFELSPDAIFLINNDGKIVRFNSQAATVFGYTSEGLEEASIESLLPERHAMRVLQLKEQYRQSPPLEILKEINQELYGLRKNGEIFPIEVSLSSVKIEEEWLVIAVVRDVSAQKQAQEELAEVQHRLLDGLEAERLLLAQEIHDGTIQDLFSVNFQLAEISNDLSQDGDPEITEKVRYTSEMVQGVIQNLRNISRELRPPALAPFGLEQAIYSHMEHFQELHAQIAVHLNLEADNQTLGETVRLVLFRIYQNAVSNVVRHAEAQNIWINFSLEDGEAILEIRDDGKGFIKPDRWVELARRGHLGLIGMRERVVGIGGNLQIKSQPGEGTIIRVTVPHRLKS